MTGLERWVRDKARKTVDGVFCSSAAGIERVGDASSGWVMQVNPRPVVAFCAGIGQGMSFEVALAKMCTRPVVVMDPAPIGKATVAKSDMTNLEFLPVGLAAEEATIAFTLAGPESGCYSVVQEGDADAEFFECWNLDRLMARSGDKWIDLLKMDIEGFEYDILDRVLAQGIPVRQICVEFHPWLKPGRTWPLIRKLYKQGYRIIHKHRGDHTFLMNEGKFEAMCKGLG